MLPCFAGVLGVGRVGIMGGPTNWSSDAVPNNPTTNVCITDGLSTVTLNQNASVGSLQLAGGNTVSTLPGFSFTIAGPQFVNEGDFEVNAGSSFNSIFSIAKDAEIINPSTFDGFITLNSTGAGSAFVRGAGHTLTLDPFATIQGSGAIGDDGLKVNLTGTIDANQTGKALSLNAGNGGVANHEGAFWRTMEASFFYTTPSRMTPVLWGARSPQTAAER